MPLPGRAYSIDAAKPQPNRHFHVSSCIPAGQIPYSANLLVVRAPINFATTPAYCFLNPLKLNDPCLRVSKYPLNFCSRNKSGELIFVQPSSLFSLILCSSTGNLWLIFTHTLSRWVKIHFIKNKKTQVFLNKMDNGEQVIKVDQRCTFYAGTLLANQTGEACLTNKGDLVAA